METFIKSFVREGTGAWQCVEAAELQLAVGRIQVTPGTRFTLGTIFMGIDVAALLEEHHLKNGASGYAGSSQCS